MKKSLDAALAHCLEEMEREKKNIEQCLDLYPQYRHELDELLRLASRLSACSDIQPSPAFQTESKNRLQSKLQPRRAVDVNVRDRIRTYIEELNILRNRMKPKLSWALITAFVLATLGVGGAGIAYAADGSSPGDVLYGIDLKLEALHLELTSSPEERAALALAFAEERLEEIETISISGAPGTDLQQAVDGYSFNISQAGKELASLATSGDESRAQALAHVLHASLTTHSQVIGEIRAKVPQPLQTYFDQAIVTSQAGKHTIESIFSEGFPGGRPEISPGGPPLNLPLGLLDRETGTPPESAPSDPISSLATDIDQRISVLDRLLEEVQDHFSANRIDAGQAAIMSYKHDLEALASDLSALAQQDEAQAKSITAQFDSALSVHAEILLQLVDQVPAEVRPFIEQALNASDASRQILSELFPEGIPGGPPGGLPNGRP